MKTITVSWQPDATAAIQAALDQASLRYGGGLTVVIPYEGRDWIVDPLFLRSYTTLKLRPHVRLLAKRKSYRGLGATMLTAHDVANVALSAYGATMRGWGRELTDVCRVPHSQWRMGVRIASSKNVTIEGVAIENFCGSGLAVGTIPDRRVPSQAVIIRDVLSTDNYREGLFVASAIGLYAVNSEFSRTAGHNTQAGVDLEPNHHDDQMLDVRFVNCRANSNNGSGYSVWLQEHGLASPRVDIRFINCSASDTLTRTPISMATDGLGRGSVVRFEGCTFLDQFGKPADTLAEYEDCAWGQRTERVTR